MVLLAFFFSFSCYGSWTICSFLFFPFNLCSWRLMLVTLQSVENLWLNDTKEKILVHVVLIYILLIKKTAKRCVHLSSLFSPYIFFNYYFTGYFYHAIFKIYIVVHTFLHRHSKWDKQLSSILTWFRWFGFIYFCVFLSVPTWLHWVSINFPF